jgi:putative oxidoreductase
MPSIFPQLFAFEQLAPFILRLVLGIIFVIHGYPKLFKAYSETVKFFESVGIKPAKFWVFVVGAVEFFGGIALIVGFFTQIAAILIAINMLVAILWVKIWKFKKGLVDGYEFDLILLAVAIALLFLGAGAFAVDLPL